MITLHLLVFVIAIDLSVSSKSVTIIGGTSVLGKSLLFQLLQKYESYQVNQVYVSYRDKDKANNLLEQLKAFKSSLRPKFFHHEVKPIPPITDIDDEKYFDDSIPGFGHCNANNEHILIYCAGIICNGNKKSDFEKQLLVNAVFPILLSYNLIRQRRQRRMDAKISIVNISSGDGESVFITSTIYDNIQQLKTISEYFNYIHSLVASHDESFEYAFGESPGYSLSKALLNRGTILLHDFCQSKANDSFYSDDKLTGSSERVISICPGNFKSSMTSVDEMNSLIDPTLCAEDVLTVALNSNDYMSGKFYRHCKVIDW